MISMAVNKVVLGGTIFHIEQEGWELLNEFLEPIRKSHKDPEKVFETELHIAEVLLSFLNKGKTEIEQQEIMATIEIIRSGD